MNLFSGTLKDKITNIFALVAVVAGVWQGWAMTSSDPVSTTEWVQLAVTLIVALVAWFTGKDSNGKAKVE